MAIDCIDREMGAYIYTKEESNKNAIRREREMFNWYVKAELICVCAGS